MAQPDGKRRWREAALGGALVALGGALFGARRGAPKPVSKTVSKPASKAGPGKGGAKPGPAPRPNANRAKVRTKPNTPEVTAPTRYWPPPPPKPLDVYDDGITPPEQAVQASRLPVDEAAVKRGYESGDARPGAIVKVMLGSGLVIVCAIAGLFVLIGRQHRIDGREPPLTQQQLAVIVPPDPRLQDHPIHDIAMENKREFDLLEHYAWTGPEHRTGRIPIARAAILVTGRPLDPPPSAGPDAVGAPAAAPTSPAGPTP